MPSPPKPPPVIQGADVTNQQIGATTQTAENQQGLNQIDYSNPYQSQTWSTMIDPTTGLPRYQSTQAYSPIQQALANIYQGTGIIGGGTGENLAASMAGTYGQAPDFLQGSNSLINQYTQGVEPNFARFGLQQVDQARTQLLNSGIDPNSPAGKQTMDNLTNQLNLTMNQSIAQYAPTAMNMATQAYNTPIQALMNFKNMGQPVGITAANNPQVTMSDPNVPAAYQIQQQGQQFDYNAQVNAQNNLMSMIGGGLLGGIKALGSMPAPA